MGLGHYLFGFSGRINRAKQWAIILVGLVFEIVVVVLFSAIVGWAAVGHAFAEKTPLATFLAAPQIHIFFLLACALYLLMLFVAAAVTIKRLHDRNKSAWWLLVFFVLPIVLNIPMYLMVPQYLHMMQAAVQAAQNHLPPPQPPRNPLATLANGAATIISLWAFVELYCLRGTVGDNHYGPDPLAGRP